MATVKSLAGRLHDLRIKYQDETSGIQKWYEDALAQNKERTAKIKKFDYAEKYRARYMALYNAMGKLYEKITAIEKSADGLKFTVSSHIKSAKAEKFAAADALTFFDGLVKRCSACAEELEKAKPFDEYEADLKNFCALYATAEHIHLHADEILKESGVPEGERAADLEACARELKEIKEKHSRETGIENLPCYGEMTRLVSDVKSSSSKIKEDMLGSGKFYYNSDFKYLMGFWKDKISEEDVAFAREVLGLTAAELSSQPIYFTPEDGRCNIVINLHAKDFSKPAYVDFVKNLYYSIMSRLPKNSMKFGSVLCNGDTKDELKFLERQITDIDDKTKPKDSSYIFLDSVEDEDEVDRELDGVKELSNDIKFRILKSKEKSVFTFNRNAEQSREELHFLCVDSYPCGFNKKPDGAKSLRKMMRVNNTGFFVVVVQNVDAAFTANCPQFTEAEDDLNAVYIDMTDLKHIRIDGKEVNLDIRTPDFDEIEFKDDLKQYYTQKEIFYMNSMLDEVDARRNELFAEYRDKKQVMPVPLGYEGKSLYSFRFDLNSACHTFIRGGSGSGKSSFLHTLIQSMAYNYSPDEVGFYLADRKGMEFEFYEKIGRLPHVRYYLANKESKASPSGVVTEEENNKIIVTWIDMAQMIMRIMRDRNTMFSKAGVKDILGYNKIADKKLPYVVAIFDEFQSVFTSVDPIYKRTLSQIITMLLKLARSAGIVLIMIGQTTDIGDISMDDIPNRILLQAGEDDIRYLCYSGMNTYRENIRADFDFLNVPKDGRVLVGKNGGTSATRFRTAFIGDEVERKLYFVDKINERYKNVKVPPMIIGGTVDPFYITDPTVPPYDSMTEPVLKEGLVGDEREDKRYDKEAYPLYVGVTANDSHPIPLAFSSSKTACGYTMHTADSDRMHKFINSTVLSFLYKTAKMGVKYTAPRVHYFATDRDIYEDFDELLSSQPYIGGHMQCHDVKFGFGEAAEALVGLLKLYKERFNTLGGFKIQWDPILVVLHDVGWLVDGSLKQRVSEANAKKKSAPAAKPAEGAISEKEIAETMESCKNTHDILGDSYTEESLRQEAITELKRKAKREGKGGSFLQSDGKTKEDDYKLAENDIIEAYTTLFTEGNNYGIFMLVASEKRGELITFQKDMGGAGLSQFTVFGTNQEATIAFNRSDPDKEITEENNICYINPGAVKTRIYQFRPYEDAAWFAELKKLLKG